MSYSQIYSLPWQARSEWREMILFLDTIKNIHGPDLDPVRLLAQRIKSLVESLSDPIEELCAVTCPDCRDVCCERATIWYDFKDILYLYFGSGIFPDRQIKKIPGQGICHCIHLTQTGCILPRSQRPFVCSWYFCPDQKHLSQDAAIPEKIIKIKKLRLEMEAAFCSITAG